MSIDLHKAAKALNEPVPVSGVAKVAGLLDAKLALILILALIPTLSGVALIA